MKLTYIFLLSGMLQACSYNHLIKRSEVAGSSWVIAAKTQDMQGRIVLQKGIRFTGQEILVGTDSTFWTDVSSGARLGAPTTEVEEIVIKNRMGHGAAGLLLGSIMGFGISYYLTTRSNDDICVDDDDFYRQARALATVVGAAAGGLLGSRIKDRHVYVLSSK